MNRLGKLFVGAAMASIGASAIAIAGAPLPTINCTGGPCTGTAAAEQMNGTDQRDQIRALGGSDSMFANDADDVLRGGTGDDFGGGGLGDDTYVGGSGSDSFLEFSKAGGDQGKDLMKGGRGADELAGGVARDRLVAGKGNDRFKLKPPTPPRHQVRRGGNRSCFRGFCSLLFGDEGGDLIKGGKGKDYMEGEEGRDRMLGGKGNDVIDAANDDTPGVKDVVKCGDGRDFVFANGRDEVADDCEKVKPPLPVDEI